ncbi:MAG: glycosyltransferase [Bacteroidales bacterium]|nr:glycosyltransferase [Bacteroidales bacterium]
MVKELYRQAEEAGIGFEILLFDDQSDAEYREKNSILETLPHVRMYSLPSKAGRSVARNFLAAQATCPYCLFIDCDSEMVDDKYIRRYLPYCNGERVVVCGGTSYRPDPPARDSLLRWTYGVRCEIRSAAERNRNPNAQFSAFNSLMQKSLFLEIRFNELLKNYGHEDTLFGFELRKKGITITHIDNPLYHVGIDTNKVYLEKTRQGVENLKLLMEQYDDRDALVHDVRLLRYYSLLAKYRLDILFFGFFYVFKRLILMNLNGRHPNMALFNLYKLGYLCGLKYVKL